MDYRKFVGVGAILLLSMGNLPVKAQVEPINLSNSTRQIDVTLKTTEGQTFNQLIQQAEIQAVSLIEQEFANDSSIAEIAVTILGDRQGQQVPLLFSKVSRTDWQQQPIIGQWTKYFATSAVLLGFNQPQKTPAPQTQPIPNTQNNNLPPTSPRPSSLPPAPPIPNNSRPPTPSPNNAPPASGGASLEETDPGYR